MSFLENLLNSHHSTVEAVFVLSEENVEEEYYESENEEQVVEVPVICEGSAFYVCSECGCNLTEIPYYNRYYCENCGLHY